MRDKALIEEVRRRSDIVEVISEYVALNKRGRDYLGLCPFHHEKTPSFHVSPDKGLFYCFGCQAGGNVFTFLQKQENLTFFEALKLLADRAGILLSEQENPEARNRRLESERAYRALEITAGYFARVMAAPRGKLAREYLGQRGVSPETAELFGLGYAPETWDRLIQGLQRQGFRPEFLARLGLMTSKDGYNYYGRFRNRLMFPIHDLRGRIVGFGGRALADGQQPKYLNSPESSFFNKGRLLYGLHLARDAIRSQGRAVIVEGYMDAIACHQAGIRNVVASMGTALTVEQGRLLQQQASEITMAYDSDQAGAAATLKGIELLYGLGCRVRVLRLEGGKDPDEYIKSYGVAEFARCLESAETLTDYKLRLVLGEPPDRPSFRTMTPQEKADAIRGVVPVLASIPDAVERGEYLKKIAAAVEVKEDAILQELKKSFRSGLSGSLRDRSANSWNNKRDYHQDVQETLAAPKGTKAERDLLAVCLERPDLIPLVRDGIELEWFTEPSLARLAADLLAEGADPGTIDPEQQPLAISLLKELRISSGNEPLNLERLGRRAEDCITVLSRHKLVRRMAEIEKLIAEFEKNGRVIPPEILKEHQELARRIHAEASRKPARKKVSP